MENCLHLCKKILKSMKLIIKYIHLWKDKHFDKHAYIIEIYVKNSYAIMEST